MKQFLFFCFFCIFSLSIVCVATEYIVLNYKNGTSEKIEVSKISKFELVKNEENTGENERIAGSAVLCRTLQIQNKTIFIYSLIIDSEVKITIFDVNCRLIKTIIGQGCAGDNSIEWNCSNNDGKQVQAGLYFYEFRSGNNILFGKLMLLN